MKFFVGRFRMMWAIALVFVLPLLSMAREGVGSDTVKPLAEWDGIQMRLKENDKWRDLRFGTLEAHGHGLVHRGRKTTTIPWKRMVRLTLHPLDNRIRVDLESPEARMVLDTLLNWSRYDFEMIYRDIERFRGEALEAERKEKKATKKQSEQSSQNDNHMESGGE